MADFIGNTHPAEENKSAPPPEPGVAPEFKKIEPTHPLPMPATFKTLSQNKPIEPVQGTLHGAEMSVPVIEPTVAPFREPEQLFVEPHYCLPESDPADVPLFPSSAEITNFFSRGPVIGAIAVLLLVSLAIDRLPVHTSQTSANDAEKNTLGTLAMVGAQKLGNTAAKPHIRLYFNNGVFKDGMTCDRVFPIERTVADPSPETALELLLVGPTTSEGNDGYFTAISPGVGFAGVTIENDIALADFDTHLTWNVTNDSCRAKAIRAQITETLKQFSGVKNVKITSGGTRRL